MKRRSSYYSIISGIVIDQMIVGSEIEIKITKVIGEADQGPENNIEMRKGIYTKKGINANAHCKYLRQNHSTMAVLHL